MEDRKLVVVGVDGSEDGLRAVKYGASFAAEIGGELLLVHAVDDAMLAGAWGVVYDPEVLQNAGVSANEAAAFEQAQLLGARLEIVHALQPPIGLFGPKLGPADLEELIRFTRGGIEAMASEQIKTFPGVPYEVVVVAATPINEFVTRSENYDLLVLGAGEEAIPGFGLGGLLRGLMAHSLCPLYITHGK